MFNIKLHKHCRCHVFVTLVLSSSNNYYGSRSYLSCLLANLILFGHPSRGEHDPGAIVRVRHDFAVDL